MDAIIDWGIVVAVGVVTVAAQVAADAPLIPIQVLAGAAVRPVGDIPVVAVRPVEGRVGIATGPVGVTVAIDTGSAGGPIVGVGVAAVGTEIAVLAAIASIDFHARHLRGSGHVVVLCC